MPVYYPTSIQGTDSFVHLVNKTCITELSVKYCFIYNSVIMKRVPQKILKKFGNHWSRLLDIELDLDLKLRECQRQRAYFFCLSDLSTE